MLVSIILSILFARARSKYMIVVDLETEKYIQEQLSSLDFACTKIIVAQRISTTKRADRIVILDKGRIADIGTHEELIARPGYYREVYELQNGITKEGGAA